jgi:RNA polymerase sigma-70 factor (ECF subfamily)
MIEPTLLRFFMRRTRKRDPSRDLLQETYARLLSGNVPLLTDQAAVHAYVMRTAMSALVDWHRNIKRQPVHNAEDIRGQESTASDVSTEDDADMQQRSERLIRAITALAPPRREIAELRFARGLSYREISALMNIPEQTVKWHLALAVRSLSKALRKRGA